MWRVYFGEWRDGRLKRLPYLGYYVLLMAVTGGIVLGMFLAIGAGMEEIGDMLAAQMLFVEKFGILMVLGFLMIMFAIMIAQFNIFFKRVRDMGLPPLWTFAGLIAVSVLLNILFPVQQVEMGTAVISTAESINTVMAANASQGSMAVQLFDLAVFLSLLLIPSDTFNKRGD